ADERPPTLTAATVLGSVRTVAMWSKDTSYISASVPASRDRTTFWSLVGSSGTTSSKYPEARESGASYAPNLWPRVRRFHPWPSRKPLSKSRRSSRDVCLDIELLKGPRYEVEVNGVRALHLNTRARSVRGRDRASFGSPPVGSALEDELLRGDAEP